MARYKTIDTSPKLLPIDLSCQLPPGTFEHALNHLIDHELDLSGLENGVCNMWDIARKHQTNRHWAWPEQSRET